MEGRRGTYFFGGVDEGVGYVPAGSVGDGEAPGEGRVVEVDEEAEGEVA
jgi:hypothetical protein